MNIKYRSLKAFLLAADATSFTQAAEQLGVTQPSFTALIKDLEAILGLKLFDRTTRSVALTQAGAELLQRVKRPVLDLEEAYRCMHDFARAGYGSVTIGVLPSVALSLIPKALKTLHEKHPAIDVHIIEAYNDDLIAMVRSNEVHFAVGTLFTHVTEFQFISLMEDEFVVVCQPDSPVRRPKVVTWKSLYSQDLILLSQGSSARALFDHAVAYETNKPSGQRYEVTHMTTAVRLVKKHLGATLLPRLALSSLDLEKLIHLPLAENTAQRTIGTICRRDRNMSPAANALWRELKEAAISVARQL